MERQLAACLAVRGWLEATYYQLGSDPNMSYMAAMGGWGILDYAINFSSSPCDWLQLGYASYLSSWSLINSGRPETDFGFWSPGEQNDGAAGWQFMSEKFGHAWMGTDVPRGPWHYDGEIDLGFGAALRMASTVVTCDPVFGWIAYGGELRECGEILEIVPRDGLRQRFAAVLQDRGIPWFRPRSIKLELDRDGFTENGAIKMHKDVSRIAFTLENRTSDTHCTGLRLSPPPGVQVEVMCDGQKIPLRKTGDWEYPRYAEIGIKSDQCHIEIILV
jgi:hypothetical protein